MAVNHTTKSNFGISFSGKWREIFIFHSTIQALGDPYFIRFLLNLEKGHLALQRCEKKEQESFLVPDCETEERWMFRIYSERLIRILWRQFGWKQDLTYRCFGVLYPEYSLVDFDLNKAEPEIKQAETAQLPQEQETSEHQPDRDLGRT